MQQRLSSLFLCLCLASSAALFSSGFAAPNPGTREQGEKSTAADVAALQQEITHLSQLLLETELSPSIEEWTHKLSEQAPPPVHTQDIISDVHKEIQEILRTATVYSTSNGGNTAVNVRNTSAITVGANNATNAVNVNNGKVLVGSANSTVSIAGTNGGVYGGVKNSTLQLVSTQSKVAASIENSTASLVVTDSTVLLALTASRVRVVAIHSDLTIANRTSLLTVVLLRGSKVKYVDFPDDGSDHTAASGVQAEGKKEEAVPLDSLLLGLTAELPAGPVVEEDLHMRGEVMEETMRKVELLAAEQEEEAQKGQKLPS